MRALLEKDLPHGLHQLLYYWAAEELNPEVLEMVCDKEISEEEEVKMFLEWCQTEEVLKDMSEEDKRDLLEVLAKMN